jgi:thermitase
MKATLLSTSLVLVLAAPSAANPPSGSGLFDEVPGVRELSGYLIARPVSVQQHGSEGVQASAPSQERRTREVLAGCEVVGFEPRVGYYVLRVGAGETERGLVERLLASGCFEYVVPDWTVFPTRCPNDPRFDEQWHHAENRLDSCRGWDIHTGGPDAVVAVCDTGVRKTHQDLLLNRREGYNAEDRLWESQGGQIDDINGHGTAVTGSAAANGDNGKGICGMGWNLGHRMVRVSNRGDGSARLSDIHHGALTAAAAGDRVVCVPYAGVDNPANLAVASEIKALGGLLFWSAGGEGLELNWGDRDDDDLIVVGAVDQDDRRASFSSYGRSMDLVAPAVNILTTGATSDNSYVYYSGTSFAVSLASGLGALVWSYNGALTPDQVERILKDGCVDLGQPGVDDFYGHGRIHLRRALELSPPPCPGDLNGDGVVELADLAILLADFGCAGGCAGDVDGDGDTDQADLAALLAVYGEPC